MLDGGLDDLLVIVDDEPGVAAGPGAAPVAGELEGLVAVVRVVEEEGKRPPVAVVDPLHWKIVSKLCNLDQRFFFIKKSNKS